MMIRNYGDLTAAEIVRQVKSGQLNAVDLAETALNLAESEGRRLNAIITVCHRRALSQAETIDQKVIAGEKLPLLAGVPVIVKDNIVYSGYPTTCGSRILENYISPYDSACIMKLQKAGAVIIAKANMDEFAMGSSSENSAYGPVKNPIRDDLVPGGSSGGSSAAVAAGIVPIAYGSDTGGSVRQPAAMCGVVGLKPTYGTVSRHGLVAFASSTDQIGPLARNVADCALAYEAVAGFDANDSTSIDYDHPAYSQMIGKASSGRFRVGVPQEYLSESIDEEIKSAMDDTISKLKTAGYEIEEITLPHTRYAVAAYYIIANAEASSNLARYDGIRYGRSESRDQGIEAMYDETRSAGFGAEVKRRIMLGTFALSAGYYDDYYLKARKVRELITGDFQKAFKSVDLIITPTSPAAAFRIGEKLEDPLQMYLSDILTIPASLAGIPAISIPCGRTADGRPIGMQIMAPALREQRLLSAAGQMEKIIGYNHA